MSRRVPLFLILIGCFLVILGFLLPWYMRGLVLRESAASPPSGFQLWLGAPSVGLTYAPGVVPEFFALLWIVPVAVLCIGVCSMGKLVVPHWNDRWLCLGIHTVLLLLLGMFLWPALMQGSAQFGLVICLIGWFLIALGALMEFRRSSSEPLTREVARASPAHPTRRTVLRGLVGMVGMASLGGTGGGLLWKTWRTHTAVTTYRYRDPVSGHISSGGAPDFNRIVTVDWSPDGKRILVAQLAAPPQSWAAFSGEARQTYQPAEAEAALWSPSGRQIAFSQRRDTDQPFLVVVNATTGVQVAALPLGTSQITELARFAWSPDSHSLALADADDLAVKLWDPVTGKFGNAYTIPSQDRSGITILQDVAWSPDGQYLAATIPQVLELDATPTLLGSPLAGVYVWHIQSGALLLYHQAALPLQAFGGSLLRWSPDGRRLAFANKTMVQILDLVLQRPVLTYTGHVLLPTSIAWSPSGTYLASAGYDWTVQIWEAATGALRFLYQGHSDAVNSIAWSPDGTYLVSGSDDGTAQVWQPEL
jgi:dipeptidyl aminopeptidase/acylaminoacyl peptidase